MDGCPALVNMSMISSVVLDYGIWGDSFVLYNLINAGNARRPLDTHVTKK